MDIQITIDIRDADARTLMTAFELALAANDAQDRLAPVPIKTDDIPTQRLRELAEIEAPKAVPLQVPAEPEKKPAESAETEPAPEPAADTPKPEPAAGTPDITPDELKRRVVQFIHAHKEGGKQTVKTLLQRYGVGAVSELAADQVPAMYADIQTAEAS